MALAGVLFLGEKLSLKLVIAIPLALLGLFLVVGIQWERLGGDYKLGVYAGLIAAVCYTLFLLSLRKIQNLDDPLSTGVNLTVISFLTAAFWPAISGARAIVSTSRMSKVPWHSLFTELPARQSAG